MNLSNMGTTNLDTLDLENDLNVDGDVAITGDLTVTGGISSGSGTLQVLSTTTGIDAKTTGQTTLYTVPTGKVAVIEDVVYRVTAVTNATVDGDFGVGLTAGFNGIVTGDQLNSTLNLGESYSSARAANILANQEALPAGSVIKFNVTTGVTATTFTISVDLIGYLLDT